MNGYDYDLALINAQVEELEKIAIGGRLLGAAGGLAKRMRQPLAQRAGRIGKSLQQAGALRGAGVGAGIGAGAGALHGAASADPQLGESRLGGAISGAFGGAALGAGAGIAATGGGRKWVGNQAKAQAHGLTGWVPGSRKAGKGFFGQKMTGSERMKAMSDIGFHVPEKMTRQQAGQQVAEGRITGRLSSAMQDRLSNLTFKRNEALRRQVAEGHTSVPGFVRGMVKDPRGTAATGLMAAGGLGTALNVGFAAPEMVNAAREGDASRFGGSLAETAFYSTAGGVPMLASGVMGSGVRAAGAAPGKIQKALANKRAAREAV